ncbi:type VI secretion system tip protein VgrG [Burkholderia multivorans]|uniref:type VI secretion system Vgr family protein n=1 Tax=Burkholderia multivorans TaxID=87883 RepID=UPI00143E24E4|nr:type VI secretion system Vgr family protein [Burkholderia multivorans]MBU9465910.1 type VI secretion system tip protein VgrG [Burkholderia multivorans]MCA8126968.1 type VI secretion system tip protein VgrG [Burkholderia multivorans]MDN8000048.1 type VI secretion system Vgr family protein [Burkholderia multivorans]QIX16165.1 type VI secretion system tip protein VgrG [Burkholderia multivorans]
MAVSISETISSFASGAVDWNRRPVALNFGKAQGTLGRLLALQHAHVHEGLMTGIRGHLTCVSPRHDLSPRLFLGVPVSLRLVTDRGQLHFVNAIIQDVQIGQSDGELCVYQLTVCDALSLMDKRTNSRVFRQSSVIDILATLFNEWRQRSSALAAAFEFDLSHLSRDRYPARELTRQVNESDAKFVRRLLRREGITVFAKYGPAKGARNIHDDTPVHTLVCCDDPASLPQAPAGTVRLHPRDAGTEERDTVTLFALHQQLMPGKAGRPSWDYKKARIDESVVATSVDQGEAGNDLAQLLTDIAIDIPHVGDSWNDHERLTRARMLAHQFEAERYDGVSSVRDLAVGAWITLTGDPEWDMQTTNQRQFVITSIDHDVWNNLPKGLTDRVQALFAASRHLAYPSPIQQPPAAAEPDTRYENRFTCVRRGVPLTPAYDPRIDLPPVHLLTGTIVGQEGEEVFCDADGRVRVRIHGLDPADHAHAQGAGTNDNGGDSAPIRVGASLAGGSFGALFLPRVGMEVLIGSLGGDPDRLVIINVLSNGANPPAAFTHVGNLPGNRYVSGIKTKEIKGRRYNQLRLDDTPGQISSQLASEHAHSQLNLGYLTQPRQDGQGQDRGEGAELRTDAAAALRAAQGILLTTYARSQASGGQLDREELLRLLGECTELFKSLGDYAGQHGGLASDAQPQDQLVATVKNWNSTTNDGTAAQASGVIVLGAEAGTVNVTPKSHVAYAGENIDQVAQQHVQMTSGQRLNATAGQGMNLFARGEGLKAVAGEGPLLLQAQADTLTANAQKDIKLTSNEGQFVAMAKTIRLVAEDGSYIEIGNGVTIGTNGSIKLLSASHQWGGPSTQQVSQTPFSRAPTDQQFRLHFPGHTDETPAIAANRSYRISLDDGRVIEGKSDANGLTNLLKDDMARIAKIDILKPTL